MLPWVTLGRRLRPELLVFRHQIKVLIILGCLCVISELIDTVLLGGFLSFKALVHGGDAIVSSGLIWLWVVAIEVAFLSTVEAFLPGVVLRIGWRALLGLGFGRRDRLIRARI